MWIVLLDHSGSMGDPFEASAEQIRSVGRVRSVEVKTKWEAAKQSFLLELRRLPGEMQVLLYGFTGDAHLIHSGVAAEVGEFERSLEKVSPTNGTNIAAALHSILDQAGARPQVLLITDGISDLEDARAEARLCANAGIRVDVLVIDPTDKGIEMAKVIAGITQGRWDPVTAADQLEKGTDRSAADHRAVLARTQEILQQADVELAEIRSDAQDKAKVSFSAGYPARMEAQRNYPLVVYIHLDELKDKIQEFLNQEIASTGATPASSTAAASTRIPPGTLITVRPHIPDIFANPQQQEVIWMEDYHRVLFQIRYTGAKTDGTVCSGFVDVYANEMLVGNIPVSIAISATAASAGTLPPVLSTGNTFTRIFASYAHEDDAIVRACKEAYKLLGIHLYVDRDDLLSGQPWREALQKLIVTSDLFQLYWSRFSADSIEVEKEWRLALQVGAARTNNFIRPFYWQEPLPPPPQELGHLHFAYLDPRKLRVPVNSDDLAREKEPEVDELPEIEAVFPVISLTGEDTQASIAVLQKSTGQVTSYLERLTGLRYYPPATLLVDDYIVKAVRSQLVVDHDQEPAGQAGDDNIEFVLGILQALALAFHVRALDPEQNSEEDLLKKFYELRTDLDWQDFWHVRTMCEYLFAGPVKKFIGGEDPFQQASYKNAQETVEKLREELGSRSSIDEDYFWPRYVLLEEVGHFYAVATPEDKKALEQIFGSGNLQSLLQDSKTLTSDQLLRMGDQCLSKKYLSVTEKYRNRFFDLFKGGETSFCRSSSFTEYLDRWSDQWLKYLEIAARKNNTTVRIGYQPPQGSLDWLLARFPDIKFSQRPEWSMSTAEIHRTVNRLRTILLDSLKRRQSGTKYITQYFVGTASTYGIFADAESRSVTRFLQDVAKKQSWPAGVALEGSPKILLCANALERYRDDLLELGVDRQQVDQMAAWFLIATLVHEHFHGILATGVDKYGKASWASRDPKEWQCGDHLNESLAAWTERYFFRNNPAMFENISEYIHSGPYPDWPYRGAEKVEEIYKKQGVRGIRALIKSLREDPKLTQESFDELQ